MFRKRILPVLLLTALCLCGCGEAAAPASSDASSPDTVSADTAADRTPANGSGRIVGICMPDHSEASATQAQLIREKLEQLDYTVIEQYAEDDVETQIRQLRTLKQENADCIILCPVDSADLTEVETDLYNTGIPVIAYDRLLMNTPAAVCFLTFDYEAAGADLGAQLIETAGLDQAQTDSTKTIEFFMGSPDDGNALRFYEGLMQVLRPCLEDGRLQCLSGETGFSACSVLNADPASCRERYLKLLDTCYKETPLDLCVTGSVSLAAACREADASAAQAADGKNPPALFTLCMDDPAEDTVFVSLSSEAIADACVRIAGALSHDETPVLSEGISFYNGVTDVPAYLCEPVSDSQ